jgi:hypothetical protein
MKPKTVLAFFSCKIGWPVALLPFVALLTGCPHNDYTVTLKPTAGGVERTLTFYRADGCDSNGVPKYQEFPSNELVTITRAYPAGAVSAQGKAYVATGKFTDALPADVGGAGSCQEIVSTLGTAGFYQERFRGHDDLAATAVRRWHAADALAELVMGWAKSEFGHERGYAKLRQFLDGQFRNDLKNVALYSWFGAQSGTNGTAEFSARFGLYLQERGYLKMADVPAWPDFLDDNSPVWLRCLQRLAAEKMQLSATPLPKSFSIFSSPEAFQRSWEKYLAGTDLYRAQLKIWEKKKKSEPQAEPPKPRDATGELVGDLLGFGGASDEAGDPDHLTVKLTLPHAPDESTGEWTNGQVVWSADLKGDLNALPVFCFAQWSEPDAAWQTAHFGQVLLTGNELASYCVWEKNLQTPAPWKDFLAQLSPGGDLKKQLAAFQFNTGNGDAGRKLLIAALDAEAKAKN